MIVSNLAARPSRDLITAAHQQITRQWWDDRRVAYDLYISQFVLDEAEAGDADAAARRRVLLENILLRALHSLVLNCPFRRIRQLNLLRGAEPAENTLLRPLTVAC